MIEPGCIIVLQVVIDNEKNLSMNDLNFALDFYVERERTVHYDKDDLIKVVDKEDSAYYAIINTNVVGRGRLLCKATIEEEWQGHRKKVILTEYTGVSSGEYSRPADSAYSGGYRLRFSTDKILKPTTGAYIFYGAVLNDITSFYEITPQMLLAPGNTITKTETETLGKTGITIEAGNKVVVLLPEDSSLRATKDDGIGGKVPFDTSIMGANGEIIIEIEEQKYRLYGELLTVGGTLYIYVN